jgi:hypothetical protein
MTEDHRHKLPIILSFLDDARRIIEGGKGRRWEVFKWTVALNTILAAAAFTQAKSQIAGYGLVSLAIIVSIMGSLLIGHYDHRMTKARERGRSLAVWLDTNASIDMYATMGEAELIPPESKDTFERYFFYIAITISLIAVAVAFFIAP